MKSVIASVALALAITASPALAEPVTREQFFATLGEGLKETYNAPPLTYGKTLAYGEFKDTQVTAFPGVYIVVSCLKGHLDTFQSMRESRDELASLHTGLTAGAALHAFAMDWKQRSRCATDWSSAFTAFSARPDGALLPRPPQSRPAAGDRERPRRWR